VNKMSNQPQTGIDDKKDIIGQTRGLYNLGLRVRGSSHPNDCGVFLLPLAAESKTFGRVLL
jgi:hypothetical protein